MYDENIEKTILYYLIFEQKELNSEELNLNENDFFTVKNRQIYNAIKELKAKKEEVNIISIKNKIKGKETGILDYISRIAESKFGASAGYAYKKLKELSKKRELIKFNKDVEKDIEQSNIEDIEIYIEKQIKRLKDINVQAQKEETFKDVVAETSDIITKKYLQKENYENKYTTGIFDLDEATNGLHAEELTIIGARPGVGKTALALKIAHNIANKGIKVAILSLEMSKNQLVERLIAKESRIDSEKIRTGIMTEEEMEKVTEATARIYELPIFINTRIKNIQDIEMYVRRLKNKEDIGLLIIDYIQLLKSQNKLNSREQEVSEITRTLKLLSLELKIPIIGLCQLNRNAARTEPTLADLRESGAIEQDADNVIFLYKKNDNEERKSVEDIVIDLQKQRAGPLTKVVVRFDKKISEFINLIRR